MVNEELNMFVGDHHLGLCNHVSLDSSPEKFCNEMVQCGYSLLSKDELEMTFKAELPRFGLCYIHVYTPKKHFIKHVGIKTERKLSEGEMRPLLEYMEHSMPVKPLYDDAYGVLPKPHEVRNFWTLPQGEVYMTWDGYQYTRGDEQNSPRGDGLDYVIIELLDCDALNCGSNKTQTEESKILHILTQTRKKLWDKILGVLDDIVSFFEYLWGGIVYMLKSRKHETRIKKKESSKGFLSDEYGARFSFNRKTLLLGPQNRAQEYIIPKGTKTIAAGAFMDQMDLERVVIPDSVEVIEENAFNGCRRLHIVVPNTVKRIGDGAFRNTYKAISADSKILFRDAHWDCIPNGITTIGAYAFEDCGNTEPISIPSSVEIIEHDAFLNCEYMDITVPRTVRRIDENAFKSAKWVIYDGDLTGFPWGAKQYWEPGIYWGTLFREQYEGWIKDGSPYPPSCSRYDEEEFAQLWHEIS